MRVLSAGSLCVRVRACVRVCLRACVILPRANAASCAPFSATFGQRGHLSQSTTSSLMLMISGYGEPMHAPVACTCVTHTHTDTHTTGSTAHSLPLTARARVKERGLERQRQASVSARVCA